MAPGQQGREIEAVLGRVVGQRVAGQRGRGRHDVRQVEQLVAGRAGLDLARPAGDRWDAVPAFPLVALDAPPRPRAVVVMVTAHVIGRGHLGPVVACEQHQRLFCQPQAVQGGHELADDEIHFEQEVTVGPGFGPALEFRSRERRQVNRLHRVKQEERPVWRARGVLLEESDAALEKHQVDFFEIVVGRDQPPPVVVGVGVLRKRGAIQ